jgi:cytochrome c oxidase accessory protein FixG
MAPEAPERVLPTLNQDGSRLWIRPRPSRGPWWQRRRAVAYGLMVVFFLLPYLRMHGRPLILLDLPRREFTLFGTTFLSTDMVLFQLLFLGAVLAIFLFTALLGRVWCGWACPQTVYMEFLFRPVERLFEGGFRGSKKLDRRGGALAPRRLAKQAVYVVLAMFLAHTFLGYFVGIETLARWVRLSPVEHPTAFLVMLATTALIFLDFAWFREQTCLVACPYGRLQSVLLDRRSLIVAYDGARGEPRRKGIVDRPADAGDCVDCRLCVQTCPTGIDIREGLQMECIHCTQCMDACDVVMERIGRPRGLIRYSSRAALEGRPTRLLRPRVVLYPAALAVVLGLFVWMLGTKADTDVTLLRGAGAPYSVEADGDVVNQVRLKVTNRGADERRYAITLEGADGGRLIAPMNPLAVAPGAVAQTSVFVVLPRDAFADGVRDVHFGVDDGGRFHGRFPYRLVGPEDEAGDGPAAPGHEHDTVGAASGRAGGA